jgi:hypothetical protein
MNLGAEPKKLAVLGLLILAAGYFTYSNWTSTPSAPAASAPPARKQTVLLPEPLPEVGGPVPRAEPRAMGQASSQDFKPSLKPRRSGQTVDLSSLDATLRLDLLDKLQRIQLQGGSRSLFEFSAAPPAPEAKVVPGAKIQTVPLPPPPPKPPEPERKPQAPPVPLKFFGYTTTFRQANRRAFFMDGDQILVASEGDVLKKRYRVVRIGVNSVVMEDLEFKAEQTLPLEPQAG